MYGGTVRFRTDDTVVASDVSLVLSTLERHLRDIAIEVVRSGSEVRAFGIGPSPRPTNPRNTSIFRAEPDADGRLLLTGEVEFQASALMEAAAQEPAVRAKIENAVRLTKAGVARYEVAAEVSSARCLPVAPAAAITAPDTTVRPSASTVVPASGNAQQNATEQVLSPPYRASERPLDQPRSSGKQPGRALNVALQHPVAMATAVLLLLVSAYLFGRLQGTKPAGVTGDDPVRVSKVIPPPEEQLQYDDPSDLPTAPKAASAAAAHVPAGTAPATKKQQPVMDRPLREAGRPATIGRGEPRSTPTEGVAVTAQDVPVVPATGARVSPVQEAVLPAEDDGTGQVSSPAALGNRLEQWAASMRSTDATQQASFYAGHLDRYFLKTDVSHDFVLRDKADFLRRGKRVERFDLEDVAVQDQTDSAARIRLVKHYVVQAGPAQPAAERLVRSELSLRKIDGTWEITGERDFK